MLHCWHKQGFLPKAGPSCAECWPLARRHSPKQEPEKLLWEYHAHLLHLPDLSDLTSNGRSLKTEIFSLLNVYFCYCNKDHLLQISVYVSVFPSTSTKNSNWLFQRAFQGRLVRTSPFKKKTKKILSMPEFLHLLLLHYCTNAICKITNTKHLKDGTFFSAIFFCLLSTFNSVLFRFSSTVCFNSQFVGFLLLAWVFLIATGENNVFRTGKSESEAKTLVGWDRKSVV